MSFGELFFGFRSRINRARYWLGVLGLVLASLVLLGILATLEPGQGLILVAVIVGVPIWIAGLALAVKRLHDRDKSGWWLLLYYALPGLLKAIAAGADGPGLILDLIGAVISIVGLIDIGFLRGTDGPNRFGPDLLDRRYR